MIRNWLDKHVACKRQPDLVVHNDQGEVYLVRWNLVRCRWFQLALHWLVRSDGHVYHNHRAWNVSLILAGSYGEWVKELVYGLPVKCLYVRRAGQLVFRRASAMHRLELVRPAWSLWLRGPESQDWYFDCPQGPVSHEQFEVRGCE
jgi:hypothetical protein